MEKNPSEFHGDNLPVESVSWYDCQRFIIKLNEMTGKYFRLPTEAEWEFAARGGNMSKGFEYSGSNHIDDVAWFEDNSAKRTHPVKSLTPNELGIYDMSGNVCEWCIDRYEHYSESPKEDPRFSIGNDSDCVLRGGSWRHDADNCRVAYRDYLSPVFRYCLLGLRLAL